MKRLLPIITIILITLPLSLSAQDELKVGVLELRNEAEITDQEAKYLTDRMRDHLGAIKG